MIGLKSAWVPAARCDGLDGARARTFSQNVLKCELCANAFNHTQTGLSLENVLYHLRVARYFEAGSSRDHAMSEPARAPVRRVTLNGDYSCCFDGNTCTL